MELIVEQTIDELGLRDAADTVVGGPLRKGISGGEKRCVGCYLRRGMTVFQASIDWLCARDVTKRSDP